MTPEPLTQTRTATLAVTEQDTSGWLQSAEFLADLACQLRERAQLPGLMARCAAHHFAAPGKLYRGRLAVLAGLAVGLESRDFLAIALASELVHNASLVHDDLQDRDPYRRGQQTVWSRFGDEQAINFGDLMLVRAFEVIGELMERNARAAPLLGALARATGEIIRGQSGELEARRSLVLDLAGYRALCRAKTGPLLAFPIVAAGRLGGLPPGYVAAAAAAFMDLGVAYQFQDDLLDLLGSKGRERPGCDLREGKLNAPMLLWLQDCDPREGESLRSFLAGPRAEPELGHWLERLRRSGAPARTAAQLALVRQQAEEHLRGLPAPLRGSLQAAFAAPFRALAAHPQLDPAA